MVPSFITQSFKKQLIYNNIPMDEKKFVGFLAIYGFLLGAGIGANAFLFFQISPLIPFFITLIGFPFVAYLLLSMHSESQGKFVEKILPDALQLIASNMKSGLTTEKSLFVAARPEFGPLQIELRNASKRIASGEKVEDALIEISDRINSDTFTKTVWLISQGISSGGQIADLLFQLSSDLENQNALQEEIRSNVSMYILLIFFAAVFGAPLLFGISSFIVQVLTTQLNSVPDIDVTQIPTSSNLGPIVGFVSGEGSAITVDFVIFFALVALVFTTLFSSLTIGVINTGKEINGLKFIIPLLLAAAIVFFGTRALMVMFFGNLV